MTQEDLIEFATGLPSVVVQTAREGDGSPEVAWGDSFFFMTRTTPRTTPKPPSATTAATLS